MKINPKVLAETLFTELLQRKHCDVPEEIRVEPAALPALEEKIRLYQFTTVLLGILNEADKKPEFIPVREHFERLYLPPRFDLDSLGNVRTAMNDLSKLLSLQKGDSGKAMFWARDWLARIGIQENNPIMLFSLALRWMDYYITVVNSLKDFDPIG